MPTPRASDPSPQMSIAAPLPLGVTSGCELLDVYVGENRAPAEVLSRLRQHLPCGISLVSVDEIGLNAPSLQSQVRRAEYVVHILGVDAMALREAVVATLASRVLALRVQTRDEGPALRPATAHCRSPAGGVPRRSRPYACVLRAEPERAARADQVAALLGLAEGASDRARRTRSRGSASRAAGLSPVRRGRRMTCAPLSRPPRRDRIQPPRPRARAARTLPLNETGRRQAERLREAPRRRAAHRGLLQPACARR